MNRYIILIFTVALFCSCHSKKSKLEKLGTIEVEIPTELKGNKEVVAYIKGMTELANGYAQHMDEVLDRVSEYAGVEESELGMMDKMKLYKAAGEIGVKLIEVSSKMGENAIKRTQMNEELSDAEVEALNNVWIQFEKRMEEIQMKYDKDFKQEETNNQ